MIALPMINPCVTPTPITIEYATNENCFTNSDNRAISRYETRGRLMIHSPYTLSIPEVIYGRWQRSDDRPNSFFLTSLLFKRIKSDNCVSRVSGFII